MDRSSALPSVLLCARDTSFPCYYLKIHPFVVELLPISGPNFPFAQFGRYLGDSLSETQKQLILNGQDEYVLDEEARLYVQDWRREGTEIFTTQPDT